MYRNIQSLCCAPGTTIVVDQLYSKNKHIHRKRDQICGYHRGGGGEFNEDDQ